MLRIFKTLCDIYLLKICVPESTHTINVYISRKSWSLVSGDVYSQLIATFCLICLIHVNMVYLHVA